MVTNDLLFAIRNFRKQKLFSSVNLLGLSLGIVATCLIMIYVQHELRYDRFNKRANQIFRVYDTITREGKASAYAQTPTPLAAFLQNKFPEISNTVRVAKVPKGLVSYGENHFFEENIILADPSVFDVFTFPLIIGNPHTVLNESNTVIMTRSVAEKYFGNGNPIGKTIRYNRQIDLTVSGIMKDLPENTHLHFNMVASMTTAKTLFGNDFLKNQMNTVVFTYLLTHPGVNKDRLDLAVSKATNEYGGFNFGNTYHIQPLTSIHLYSDKGGEYQPNGDIRTVYVLSAIALLILIIACINYINLSFSLNSRRSAELWVRKVMGAGTVQLIRLYLSDVIVLAGISVLASVVIIWLLLPWFSKLVGTELTFGTMENNFLFSLGLLFLFVVLITGPVSGWMASRMKPVIALKKSVDKGKGRVGLHGLLVLFQFGISIILIMTTLLVNKQMNFLKNKNLGFSKEELMIIPVNDQNARAKIQSFKQELLANPSILSASATSDLPGGLRWVTSIKYEGQNQQSLGTMTYLEVDKNFIPTYGIQLKEGYLPGDTACPYNGTQYLLNETAVQKLGWDQPLGKTFTCYNGKQGSVSGIIRDFHFKSLHENMEPLFLYINERGSNYLALKLATHDIRNTVSFVQQQWNKMVPDSPFEYYFYDSYYDQLYRKESRFGQIILIFSCIAILIACLGIFGLAAFLSEKRTKEIGIRKVNGAKVSEVMSMLNKDFVKWVAIAFVISCPIGWYAMYKWLQNFAYKTELSWWIFALAGLLAMGIALLTVSWQSWKAATRNPVEALRCE